MRDYRDSIPGYRVIRMGAPDRPEAAVADEQAWKARGAYPELASAGGAEFGLARELETGGWQLYGHFGSPHPQDARDDMGHHFRVAAAEHPEGSKARAAYMRAAERMDREAIDEATVLGTRYRVIRAEQFLRTGPLGPEPPRPSDPDPDPGEVGADPLEGFVIDSLTSTTMSQGILTLDLLQAYHPTGYVSAEVSDDLARAAETHPGGILLPAAYTIGRLTRGTWGPATIGTSPNPQEARDNLVGHLRVTAPYQLKLSAEKRAAYAAAADRVEDDDANEVQAGGQRFRIVRVERLARIGPDGPEGPRPSDPDPQGPVLADDGGPRDEEKYVPGELSEDAKRFRQLFYEEEERLAAKRPRPGDNENG